MNCDPYTLTRLFKDLCTAIVIGQFFGLCVLMALGIRRWNRV